MRRNLAERLLAQLMGWSDDEMARERAYLELFAVYKYDEYQQYAPGLRFLESLARWLRQFVTIDERRTAYQLIRNQLIFISEAEMTHLVELAFPTFIRPHLLTDTSAETGDHPHRIKHLLSSGAYRLRLRKTLILGLSDGARTDRFRRANPLDISNEQIWHAYDVSDDKAEDMQEKLTRDITQLTSAVPSPEAAKFTTVVLLDDFTASGTSYLRHENNGWKGKIAKLIKMLDEGGGLGGVIASSGVKVIVVIYVAAPQAIEHISIQLQSLEFQRGTIEFCVVHELSAATRLEDVEHPELFSLLGNDTYFDTDADDEHGAVGGDSVRFGYAGCRLPLVLAHNTPNNSIFLLWAEDVLTVHGLFPRVSRHRTLE